MKNYGILIVALMAVFALTGCNGSNAVPATALPSATTQPPVVENQAVPTATPTQVQPTNAPATPTVAAPTPTPEQPTPTVAAPTATPEQPTPTPAAVAATPTPAANPPAGQTSSSGCVDKAAFYADVTVPDNTAFKQNVEFTKTWQVKNEGTCTWNGYKLVFGGGSIMNAPLSNPIPLVRPGDLAEISVKLTSPNQGGVYTSLWLFENTQGKRFGVNSGGVDFIWTKISVTWYPEGSVNPGVTAINPPTTGNCPLEAKPGIIEEVLTRINQARAGEGLAALTLNATVSKAAQGHSEDMACKDFTSHVGSDGSSFYDRIKRQGYKYSYASENILYGDLNFASPAGAVDWWMNSPVHYKNMMNPKVTEIGIGYAFNPKSSYQGYYTVNFTRP